MVEELLLWPRLSVRDEAKNWFNAVLGNHQKKWGCDASDARGVLMSRLAGWLQQRQESDTERDIGGGKGRYPVSLRALAIDAPRSPGRQPQEMVVLPPDEV